MYVSVVAILIGWATAFDVRGLRGYVLIVAAAFFVRVVAFEEPWLARTHAGAWGDYVRRVRRWF
jgi:hypothetical protein